MCLVDMCTFSSQISNNNKNIIDANAAGKRYLHFKFSNFFRFSRIALYSLFQCVKASSKNGLTVTQNEFVDFVLMDLALQKRVCTPTNKVVSMRQFF